MTVQKTAARSVRPASPAPSAATIDAITYKPETFLVVERKPGQAARHFANFNLYLETRREVAGTDRGIEVDRAPFKVAGRSVKILIPGQRAIELKGKAIGAAQLGFIAGPTGTQATRVDFRLDLKGLSESAKTLLAVGTPYRMEFAGTVGGKPLVLRSEQARVGTPIS